MLVYIYVDCFGSQIDKPTTTVQNVLPVTGQQIRKTLIIKRLKNISREGGGISWGGVEGWGEKGSCKKDGCEWHTVGWHTVIPGRGDCGGVRQIILCGQ